MGLTRLLRKRKVQALLLGVILAGGVGLWAGTWFWVLATSVGSFILALFLVRQARLDRRDYPVEVTNPAAWKDSLRYYIWSGVLFGLNFDHPERQLRHTSGVIQVNRPGWGPQYNPAYIGLWALLHLDRSRRSQQAGEGSDQAEFELHVDWLLREGVRRPDGALVWEYDFDWWGGIITMHRPWISAMSQGLAISAFVRAWRLTGRPEYLEAARAAVKPYDQPFTEGGVGFSDRGHLYAMEYPTTPTVHILDGFLFAVLGAYDLAAATGLPADHERFTRLAEAAAGHIQQWNFRGRWSWTGQKGTYDILSSPMYNKLNACLVEVLGHLTGKAELLQIAQGWNPGNHGYLTRLGITIWAYTLQTLYLFRIFILKRGAA